MNELLRWAASLFGAARVKATASRCFDWVEREAVAHDLAVLQANWGELTPFQQAQLNAAADSLAEGATDGDVLVGLASLRCASGTHGLPLIISRERIDARYDSDKLLPDLSTLATTSVLAIAQEIACGKSVRLLPILADALEEAGCTDPSVLAPLRRRSSPHIRGLRIAYALAEIPAGTASGPSADEEGHP